MEIAARQTTPTRRRRTGRRCSSTLSPVIRRIITCRRRRLHRLRPPRHLSPCRMLTFNQAWVIMKIFINLRFFFKLELELVKNF